VIPSIVVFNMRIVLTCVFTCTPRYLAAIMRESRGKKSVAAQHRSFCETQLEHTTDFNDNYAIRVGDRLQHPSQLHKKRKIRKTKLTTESKLRMTFGEGPLDSMRSLARQYKCDHGTCAYIAKGIAETVLLTQDDAVSACRTAGNMFFLTGIISSSTSSAKIVFPG
jgi:hypothetical protein